MNLKFPKEVLFCVAVGGGQLTTADDWIHFAEQNVRGDRSKAQITMAIKAETWERTLQLRADAEGDEKALVFIDAPAKEKGIGTLRLSGNMWNWFPKLKRKVTVSPSMLLASWMGSDFSNDDLLKASNMWKDYSHTFLPDAKIGTESFKVIENRAKSDAKVMWPKVVSYFSTKDCMPREHRYYDKQDKLIRILALSNYQTFDGHYVPKVWEMVPQDGKGKKTVMTYDQLSFKVQFPANHFSLQELTGE